MGKTDGGYASLRFRESREAARILDDGAIVLSEQVLTAAEEYVYDHVKIFVG